MDYGVQYLTVIEADQGQRIDNYLLRKLKGVPKSHIYRIMRSGEVRVNKKRVKPVYRVQMDDVVRIPPIRLPDANEVPAASLQLRDLLKQSILLEDNRLLIINKPSGIAVHGGSGINLGVIEALRQIYGDKQYLELAHRLDRETSGCLVIAKRRSLLRQVHQLLRDKTADKVYLALVQGVPERDHFTVNFALQKSALRSGERMVYVNPEGKPAVSHFKVLERYEQASLVEVHLETGRTHQIRVHAAASGHPIAADEKYGNKRFNKAMRDLQCNRLFLHAKHLHLPLTDYPNGVSVTAELDPQLEQVLKNLAKKNAD